MKKQELEARVSQLYLQNRQNIDQYQYTVPSKSAYPYQWLWDSCFHAIVLSHFDIESAKKELQSVVAKQFSSGLIPHITYWHPHDKLRFDWGVEDTSAITQPPIIAYSVWRIYLVDNDKDFLGGMYEPLHRFYTYLLTRDAANSNLISIINPDESGEDNSPRFDEPLNIETNHRATESNNKRFQLFEENKKCNFDATLCMQNFFYVKDVPFIVYTIEGLEALSNIAVVLEKFEDAEFFKKKANVMRDAMRSYLFEDGIFWSAYGLDNKKIKARTWAMFAPLLIDAYTKEESDALISIHLLDPDAFWSSYPVPTTGMDDKAYNPVESKEGPPELHPTWRGPVWMATNWFIFRALKRHGYNVEANHIRNKSIELIEKSGFREYYHPQTGEGMGAQDFTWGGLVLDMESD